MPENFLTQKHGGLPTWGWAAIVVGGYFGWRWYQSYEAAKSAAASTATTGGTTIPADTSSTTTTTPASYSSLAAWEQAAITELVGQGMDGGDALNAITNWLNGTCVSASAYTNLSQLLTTTGLPPGFSGTSLPTLSVCPSATTSTTTPATTTFISPPASSSGTTTTSPNTPGITGGVPASPGALVTSFDLGNGIVQQVLATGNPGEAQTYENGAAVGEPFLTPAVQGYYTGTPTPYTGGGLKPGQVDVEGMVYTEEPNSTGGYG